MMKCFSENIISALLDDPKFFQWLIEPTSELEAYWQERMNEDEQLKDNAETLMKILKNIKVAETTPTAQDKEVIWARIEKDIRPKRIIHRRGWGIVSSLVACAVLLLGGYWMLVTEWAPEQKEIDYTAFAVLEAESVQGEDISLILSDNRSINIKKDSAHISYTNNGTITIGTEEIVENTDKPQLNQLVVPYGKMTSLVLSDGTKVWMNSGSKLVYPSVFEENKREIFLLGEAFLDVTPNKDAPFMIKTNHLDVNVLGTRLNVTAYNDDDMQSVLLVSGSVEVKGQEAKKSFKIAPYQMLAYETSSSKINVEEVDVSNYISWIYGYLLLNAEKLPRLLHKLERHYNISFVYNENELRNISVSGKLDLAGGLNEVMSSIALTAPIWFELTEEQIIVKLRK